ncbi:thioredoxin family protein [Neobacillus cucumis]|uniref:Thioredoxin n=1 Tax=Neobacillus cucumis TaxID=1740721 RepID=A0A2N5HNJ3_9BACI|nr:thioredoxin family protein [Neobacillus cucumis]PLS07078.1 thioredoxin [Neobacillus cucumis]
MIQELEFHTFDKFIEKGLTLVEFGAPRCAPCRIQEPILKELAEEWGTNILVAKVDVDKETDLAVKYRIQGIPTMKVFNNGKIVDSLRGLHDKEEIKSIIAKVI